MWEANEDQIVKMWVNEILTEGTSRQRETMNGTNSQLHKGGGTNRPSDQRTIRLAEQRVSIAKLCHQ